MTDRICLHCRHLSLEIVTDDVDEHGRVMIDCEHRTWPAHATRDRLVREFRLALRRAETCEHFERVVDDE